jgi:hypothetical protein
MLFCPKIIERKIPIKISLMNQQILSFGQKITKKKLDEYNRRISFNKTKANLS